MSIIHLTPRTTEQEIPTSLLPEGCGAASTEEYHNNQVRPLIWLIFGGTGALGRQISRLAIGRKDKVMIAALDKESDEDDSEITAALDRQEESLSQENDNRQNFDNHGFFRDTTIPAKRPHPDSTPDSYTKARKTSAAEDLKYKRPNPFFYIASKFKDSCCRVECDVRIRRSVDEAVQKCLKLYGRIDIVVNCFGYGVVGACEDQVESEVRSQFEVNFMGLFHTLRAVLPHLTSSAKTSNDKCPQNGPIRADSSGPITGTPGHIISFTSSMGVLGAPGFGPYSATRWAAEGLLESLAIEVEHLGCKVTIIETGYAKSPATEDTPQLAKPYVPLHLKLQPLTTIGLVFSIWKLLRFHRTF